jgi:hypothetical protein
MLLLLLLLLNPDMEDGISCSYHKDHTEQYHRILANNTHKMFLSPTHSDHRHITELRHTIGILVTFVLPLFVVDHH